MRRPGRDLVTMNKGAWSKEEDDKLAAHIHEYGEGCWRTIPHAAGLLRCGKSCRLRWVNYLKPGLKRGNFCEDEEDLIIKLHALLGNRWSLIAGRLPGRTDNEVKNYWNTHLKRKLLKVGVDPKNHRLHQTLPRPIPSEPSPKLKDVAIAGQCPYNKVSKSSHGDSEQVSDSESCLLEGSTSASTNCKLPDLNLDLHLTLTTSSVKVEHRGCNDHPTLLREIHDLRPKSPTLLLFT